MTDNVSLEEYMKKCEELTQLEVTVKTMINQYYNPVSTNNYDPILKGKLDKNIRLSKRLRAEIKKIYESNDGSFPKKLIYLTV
jgi:hypothetical protein